MIRGNRDSRPRDYLERYAPALDEYADAFNIDQLLDFDGHGVTLLPDFHAFAPNWIACHGHLGFRLNRTAGLTALNAAKRIGQNVVMGHVHRQGVVSESTGYGGKLQTIIGVEAGHTMSVQRADYLRGGIANWAAGFSTITIAGKCVTPQVIPMQPDGSFAYEGRLWR